MYLPILKSACSIWACVCACACACLSTIVVGKMTSPDGPDSPFSSLGIPMFLCLYTYFHILHLILTAYALNVAIPQKQCSELIAEKETLLLEQWQSPVNSKAFIFRTYSFHSLTVSPSPVPDLITFYIYLGWACYFKHKALVIDIKNHINLYLLEH